MNPHLRVLIVEDSEDDALLALRSLRQGRYTVEHLRVDTAAAMQAALDQQVWDVVIADYSLPVFSAPQALQLLQRQNLDLPFIIVSGTVGEEQAVAAMKAGAHDYLIKGNLTRLLPAVERELREAKERQKRLLAEQALQDANAALHANAAELEELYNHAPCGYHSLDQDGVFIRINDTELLMLGYERDEVIGKKKFSDVLSSKSVKTFQNNFLLLQKRGWLRDLECEILRKDGTILPVSLSATVITDAAGNPLVSRSVVIDISDRTRLKAERKFAKKQLLQADHELQLANSRLNGILEGTQDIIAALDLDFRFIVFNSAFQREFQHIFDKQVAVGMSLMEVLAHLPEEQAKAVDIWRRALQGEEFTIIAEFGDERLARNYYEITYSSIRDANQQIIGAAQMARDVTTRRQAEAELRNSEERYRLLFENNPNPMWVIDGQTLAFIAVNQVAIAHYGYSKTEFLGMTITDLQPPENLPMMPLLNQAPTSGQNYAGVWKHRKKDGTLIDVDILAHAFLFVGKPVWLMLVNDITERKQAEENLHIMSTALASAVEGVSQLDTQGRYLSVNAAYAAIVGYQPEELIGIDWKQTVHPDDRPKMEAAYQHMLRHGKVEVEACGIRKDGSSFYKQLVMVTTYDKQQRLIGHYCFAKDITERKQAEQKILEQAALLDITLDAICVQDLDHRILFWNKGAEHLYGGNPQMCWAKTRSRFYLLQTMPTPKLTSSKQF
jgi:PAS domain S-box-containing protein